MSTLLYIPAAFLVLALLAGGFYWFVINNRRPAVNIGAQLSDLYTQRDLLTPNELEFFGRLRNALPELQIFPQVALSAIIRPKGNGKATTTARNRIDRKVVDFALYTTDFALVCIVELDDSTHDASKDAERDKLAASASITTFRWNSRNKPSVEEIRNAIAPASARPHSAPPVTLRLVQERRKFD